MESSNSKTLLGTQKPLQRFQLQALPGEFHPELPKLIELPFKDDKVIEEEGELKELCKISQDPTSFLFICALKVCCRGAETAERRASVAFEGVEAMARML